MRRATSSVGEPQIERPMFSPHPNLGEDVNHNICESEVEGGVYLEKLPLGGVLEVETAHRTYVIENRGDGRMLISGHPKFCPEPVLVKFSGSTWGHSMLKLRFIGRGMFLEYRHPDWGMIRTSRIQEIREIQPVRAVDLTLPAC
jgi:hypothetical protein